ncbi:hypothetical protein COV82_02590 [Candidatus Peregrinibacteria bacterium CG11_big_fil_rev_8_21_14_0_20_46_8]|nr:MAG: hypothetical protein COV82_02590 [Candidatus Peregrinibacteria bacterium CG11_big_fil_rev_8_21_14_0_20_46_8]
MSLHERQFSQGTIALLLLGATLLVLFFHTVPARAKRMQAREQLAIAAERLVELSKEEAERREDAGISEIEAQELARAIPGDMSQDQLILDLADISAKADVSFNALSFSLNESSEIPSITVSGGFQGSPARLLQFLKLIETNPRKLVVQSASVDRGLVIDGNQFATLTLTLQAFYQTE